MACSSCSNQIEPYGAKPANIQWQVVRGDTSTLKVEFWENDETTPIDTDGWTYSASAYYTKNGTVYDLDVQVGSNFVTIVAPANITENWGSGYGSVVAELTFDLEVTKDDLTVWTPVIGTICVLGDVTNYGSL